MRKPDDPELTPRLATRFLRLALRRAARGTGSQVALYTRRTAMQPVPDLDAILRPLRWVLIGGLALRAYLPERATLDVDILIHERDAPAAQQALLDAGYRCVGTLSIGGFTVQRNDETLLDVLTRSDPWLDEALRNPSRDPAGLPVLGRPFLILIKLQAGPTQDLADIQRLIAFTSPVERQTVREVVEQYDPELLEDLDALITLADLEFGSAHDDAAYPT